MHAGTGRDAVREGGAPGRPSVRVCRGGRVPLRRQIAAQVGALVRSGRLGPEDRLPGARRLAARLGVHRHTVAAAYRELAREGLLEARPGSGYRVRPAAGGSEGGREAAFRNLLAEARDAGLDTAGLAGRFERWLRGLRGAVVALVASSEPTRRLWKRELGRALRARGLEAELPAAGPGAVRRLADSRPVGLVLTTVDQVPAVGSILPPAVEVWAGRPPDRRDLRARLEGLPAGSVVLAASVSPALRREVREVAAALRGPELGVREAGSPGDRRFRRWAERADLVLADAVLGPHLEGAPPPVRVLRLRALGRRTVEGVAEWVGAARRLGASTSSDPLQPRSGRP